MKKILLTLLFIYIISSFILPVHAVHYYYKQIALGDGLSSTVYCTLVDKQGFVWIGTQAGLGRFDGYELKSYVHDPDNPHSLPDNLIYNIVEDKQHNIWVLTERGIACYQRQSDNFIVPTDEKGKRIIAFSFCRSAEGMFLVLIIRCIIIIIKTLHSDWYSNSAQPPVTVLWGWNFGIRTLCFAVTVGRAYACWT